MARNKNISHEKIVISAKKEFLDKGFEKASMRQIGKLAGMTQAALYRHYSSKEEMFGDLVNPALKFFEECRQNNRKNTFEGIFNHEDIDKLFIANNIEIAKEVYTRYHDEFKLIICCAQGTRYENFIHELVEKQQQDMINVLSFLKSSGSNIKEINQDELHLLLSAYITAMFEPIVHDWPLEKALHGVNVVADFFMPGWKKIMGL